MSTTIRIDFDAKKRLERISQLEGTTLKRTLETAISLYELNLYRRFLKEPHEDPVLIKKVVEIREWLRQASKKEYKEAIKNVRK